MRVETSKEDFHVVSVQKEEAMRAIVDMAKAELRVKSSVKTVDDAFPPYLVGDGFGGYKVYFKASEPK